MSAVQRKSLYFIPFIGIDKTLEIKELRLIENNSQHDDIMPELFKGGGGTFIEVINKFCSGDEYDRNTHLKINNIMELFKFSYYITCLPIGLYPGFISESTFELFPIIEANKDKSFEHKTPITNGISTFLMKQEDYYKHKVILGNSHPVTIHTSFLSVFELIYDDCINDKNKLSILNLYNKTLRITDTSDCFDKVIFSRASIETLIDIKGSPLSKPNYIKTFINQLDTFIVKNKNYNKILYSYYQIQVKDDNGLKKSEENLEKYLKSLANARHSLVHENKTTEDFRTIEVYIAWFPLFFLATFFENKIQDKEAVRFTLFLKLLQLDYKKWNLKDTTNYNRMTCLQVYDQYTRAIIANIDNSEVIKNYLKGFDTCFEPDNLRSNFPFTSLKIPENISKISIQDTNIYPDSEDTIFDTIEKTHTKNML